MSGRKPATRTPWGGALDCPACAAKARVSWAFRAAGWVLECIACGASFAGRGRYDTAVTETRRTA